MYGAVKAAPRAVGQRSAAAGRRRAGAAAALASDQSVGVPWKRASVFSVWAPFSVQTA